MEFDPIKEAEKLGIQKVVHEESQQQEEKPAEQVEKKTEQQQEQKKEEVVVPDKFKILSETFGREFKTDDDVTAFRTSLDEYPTKLTAAEQKAAEAEAKRAELEEGIDPRSHFANDTLFTLNGLIKKFPDKNPLMLTEISTRDFKDVYKTNPIDMLAMDMMLDNPGIFDSREQAIAVVLKNHGIEPEKDENGNYDIDEVTQKQLQIKAKAVTDKFTTLKSEVMAANQPVDLKAKAAEKLQKNTERIQKITEATESLFTKEIPSELKEIGFQKTEKGEDGKDVVVDSFKYQIPEGFAKSKAVQDILKSVRNDLIQKEAEFTPEQAARKKEETVTFIKALYLYEHWMDIDNARVEDVLTKSKEETWMKRHNPRTLRAEGKAPVPDEKEISLQKKVTALEKDLGITNK